MAADYHCPGCGVLSTRVESDQLAFCTNEPGFDLEPACDVVTFNPSHRNGGFSEAELTGTAPPALIVVVPENETAAGPRSGQHQVGRG